MTPRHVGPHDLAPICGLTVAAAACPASTIITSDLRHTGNEQANKAKCGFQEPTTRSRLSPGRSPVPFYFGHLSPRPRVPDSQLGFATSIKRLDVVVSTGAVSPQGIPHWPGQPPCRHYPRPQHRMFWKMQPPDRCQGVRSFASAGREAAAPRDQGGSQSGDLALTETMPGSGPITQGGGHLKFSTRVFLRYLVQWDRSGGRRMRIWGSRLARGGRSPVSGH
jgi:hypothetical protein